MDEKVLRLRLHAIGSKLESEYFVAEEFIYNLDDLSKWMAKAPEWLDAVKQKAERLPEDDPQRKELKICILRNIDIARARHKENDPIGTKAYIAKIDEDWKNVEDNVLIEKINKVRSDNSIRGKASKRREWALKTATFLKENYPKMTKEDVWLMIPESFEPLEIPQDEPDYEIYREDKNLVAVDEETRKESTITKGTFFKKYYKKGM